VFCAKARGVPAPRATATRDLQNLVGKGGQSIGIHRFIEKDSLPPFLWSGLRKRDGKKDSSNASLLNVFDREGERGSEKVDMRAKPFPLNFPQDFFLDRSLPVP
jgi:hypothetical protein